MENILHTKIDSCFITNSADTQLTNSDIIATGYKLKIDEITYTLVVLGDVDGNGTADFWDMLLINKHRLGLKQLEKIELIAGDINKDDITDFFDMIAINNYRLGLSSL